MRATQERQQNNDESTVASAPLFIIISWYYYYYYYFFLQTKPSPFKFVMIISKLEGATGKNKHAGNRLIFSVPTVIANNSEQEIISVV